MRPLLRPGLCWLFLDDYRKPASIGIYDTERDKRQTVSFTISVGVERTAWNDAIEATTDYDFIRTAVDDLISDRHFDLQESLVLALIETCRKARGVRCAIVTIAKLDVYADAKAVGCEMSWFDDGVLLGG